MNIPFSALPSDQEITPEHTACWQKMREVFFCDPRRIGRRLPDVLGDRDGKPVTGPWRYREYRETTKCTVVTYQEATLNIIAMHLSGKLSHGQHPAWLQTYMTSEEGWAVATTIDIDVVGESHSAAPEHFDTQEDALAAARQLMAHAEALSLLPHLEITKSGGYRVWIFHRKLKAALARDLGRLLLLKANLHPKIEVFPAQGFLSEGGFGSAVFVPYNWHNARNGRQVMIDPDTGAVRMVEDFIAVALDGRSDPALVEQIVISATESGELRATQPPQRVHVEYDGDNRLAQDAGISTQAWMYQLEKCVVLSDIVTRCEAGVEIAYPEWLRLATHLRAYGEWGYNEFHRLSSFDGRYDEHQTDSLWDSLRGGPTRCNRMDCGRDPQADCGMADGKVSAVAFGYEMLRKLPVAAQSEPNGSAPAAEFESLDAQLAVLDQSDLGNSRRLLARHGNIMRYSSLEQAWYVWNKKLWIKHHNPRTAPMMKAAMAIEAIKAEADTVVDDAQRAALLKHAIKSQSRERITAALNLLCIADDIQVHPREFDAHPELASIENGTLDLRDGTLIPHNPEHMISAMMPVTYQPEATCPRFERFMREVVPDNEVRWYLQKWMGYGLTGLILEQIFLFLYGSGQNGKSTLINVIKGLMGPDLHATVASSTIMLDSSGNKNTALAMVPFVSPRSVTMTEGGEGARFDEELIKALTGGDEVKARRHYELEFGFVPKLKLTIAANHKPKITGTDKGIWRRVRLVPFEQQIKDVDKELPAKLAAERSGILNWMLKGLAAYYDEGLETPEAVQEATDEYREDSDVLGQFLVETYVKDPDGEVIGSAIYTAYSSWCFTNGHKAMANNTLANKLKERGYRKGDGRKKYTWLGLRQRSLQDMMDESREAPREEMGTSSAPAIIRDAFTVPVENDEGDLIAPW